jgi:two-component system response regulator PilR (NtrC family)
MTTQQIRTTTCGTTRTASAPPLLPAHAGRPRVLVAEDDDDFRMLLRDELGRDGLEVVDCASAPEATRRREWIDAMAGNPWSLDVVVTDVYLGESDGLSLLQGVAEAGLDVPVVLISAFGDLTARARAGELGAAAFIDKPLEMGMLRNLVDQLACERRRRVRERAQVARQRARRRPDG